MYKISYIMHPSKRDTQSQRSLTIRLKTHRSPNGEQLVKVRTADRPDTATKRKKARIG